jgi:pyridoxal phosphate enzyme (YggS family)
LAIADNVVSVQKNIPSNVTLIAVSKTKSIEEMKEVYSTGIRDFGENKVQELTFKIDEFYDDVRWHFIGHLQRNKVKYIVGKVSLIHTLDSIRLLQEIDKQYGTNGLTADVLIEINIGREESKSGIYVEQLDEIIEACEKCSNVKVKGLMAIIPKGSEVQCREYFSKMKKLWDELSQRNFRNIEMKYLSMGMTGDYKIAISEGSNMVRVGEGIFGERVYLNKQKEE